MKNKKNKEKQNKPAWTNRSLWVLEQIAVHRSCTLVHEIVLNYFYLSLNRTFAKVRFVCKFGRSIHSVRELVGILGWVLLQSKHDTASQFSVRSWIVKVVLHGSGNLHSDLPCSLELYKDKVLHLENILSVTFSVIYLIPTIRSSLHGCSDHYKERHYSFS